GGGPDRQGGVEGDGADPAPADRTALTGEPAASAAGLPDTRRLTPPVRRPGIDQWSEPRHIRPARPGGRPGRDRTEDRSCEALTRSFCLAWSPWPAWAGRPPTRRTWPARRRRPARPASPRTAPACWRSAAGPPAPPPTRSRSAG